MIDNKQYQKILDGGLILDHYHVLQCIKGGKELPKSKRIQGFVNLLNKKGYIEDGVLTDAAILLIENYEDVVTVCTSTTTPPSDKFNFEDWVMGLHTRCQAKLKELTGRTQVTDRINKKSYSFLPNAIDLQKVLHKVIFLYKLKDLDLVEKCIFQYINRCYDSKNWFPILRYYIMKDNVSSMVTDLGNMEDDKPDSKSLQKFV